MRIEDFSLIWRWTRESHALLPADWLAQMHVIEPKETMALTDRSMLIFPAEPKPTEICSDASDDEITRAWLESLSIPNDARTMIVWDEELGIRLPWHIFATNWDDFCYPSSDNVYIFLSDNLGAIAYEHYEYFRYTKSAG